MKKKLTTKTQLQNMNANYDSLVATVKNYLAAVGTVKAKTAGVFPAYGKSGEENSPTKSQPNVVFVKDLINQVQTAHALGYRTQLAALDGELFVEFIEKVPAIPVSLLYLT
jgi:hypothetical protein